MWKSPWRNEVIDYRREGGFWVRYWCLDDHCRYYHQERYATALQMKYHYKTKLYSTIMHLAKKHGVEKPEVERLDKLQIFLVQKSEVKESNWV